jgi:PIN domain nuclease of toxin-antitoxin system
VRLLLDTHVLLWSLVDPDRLDPHVAGLLRDPENTVLVSAASAWEIAIKQSLGKLTLPGPADAWLPTECLRAGFDWLAITPADALAVGRIPWHHRDPFDRLLVAQARGGIVLVTRDRSMAAYGVPVLWA